jgi:hypothetical protein
VSRRRGELARHRRYRGCGKVDAEEVVCHADQLVDTVLHSRAAPLGHEPPRPLQLLGAVSSDRVELPAHARLDHLTQLVVQPARWYRRFEHEVGLTATSGRSGPLRQVLPGVRRQPGELVMEHDAVVLELGPKGARPPAYRRAPRDERRG